MSRQRGLLAGIVFVLMGLSACAPNPLAPVESRLVAQEQATDRGYHVVLASETLYSIAFAYDLDFRTLARWNGIGSDFKIFPGQRLKLSGPKSIYDGQNRQENDENVKITSTEAPVKATELPSERPTGVTGTSGAAGRTSTGSGTSTPEKRTGTDSKNVGKTPAKTPETRTTTNAPAGPIKWQWPSSGKVLAGFSKAPTGNKGLNIAGKSGEPVKAAAAGRVVYAGNGLRGFGQLVIVKHDDDFLSAYAHNSRLHVRENDPVKAGQLIADIGTTGTDREQLHFEIRYQGQPVDPLKHLPKR